MEGGKKPQVQNSKFKAQKTPNQKLQRPENVQISNSKPLFPLYWNLILGASFEL